MAKLFSADRWIVLDDVQFARRDYQHRARLAQLSSPDIRQWLSLPTHLPHGRPTLVGEARLIDPQKCRRKVAERVRHHYSGSRHWHAVAEALEPVLDRFEATEHTADVAETSARALLKAIGWRGEVLRSSDLPSRVGRSQRLADLAAITGSTTYLCGTGGMRYLEPEPFRAQGVTVAPFRTPTDSPGGTWQYAREISALWALATIGPRRLADELLAGGESVKVVSEQLGHTNAAMTLNTYSYLFPDTEDRTRQAVDKAFQDHADPERTKKAR